MSRATRPHCHLIYTQNAITTVCNATHSHSQHITHTPGEAARFFFHNSPPRTHPQKRGGSRQDQDICLCLNKIQNSAEMQAGRRFLFSVKHTPKRLANTLLCAQLMGQTWVYTLMSTYTSLLTHKYTQTHKQCSYRLTPLSAVLPYTSK